MLLVNRWSQQHAKQYSSPCSAQNMNPFTKMLDVNAEGVAIWRGPAGIMFLVCWMAGASCIRGLVVVVGDVLGAVGAVSVGPVGASVEGDGVVLDVVRGGGWEGVGHRAMCGGTSRLMWFWTRGGWERVLESQARPSEGMGLVTTEQHVSSRWKEK